MEDNLSDYLAELKRCTEDSFLEELDELNVKAECRRALENSVGYMLLVRCGIDPTEYFADDDFRDVVDFNTPNTMNALGTATGDISRMCLSAISRTVLSLQGRQQNENRTFASVPHFEYVVDREESRIKKRSEYHIMSGPSYTMQGDYRLPNLLPPQEPEIHLGKYALLRRTYLKQHRRVTFTNLLTSGKLNRHLMEIQQTAQHRMEQITAQMAKAEGVTEELKERDPMKWTGLMNNIRHAAEETVLNELIYN